MPKERATREHWCDRCGKVFTSMMRRQHHHAVEHAPKTSEDIQRRTSVNTATDLKGLRDVRTAISTRSRAASRHKGTPYLEVLSLGMEKLRLETERARLTKRQGRIETQLGEIGHLLGERLAEVQKDSPETDFAGKTGAEQRAREGRRSVPPNVRTMTVQY